MLMVVFFVACREGALGCSFLHASVSGYVCVSIHVAQCVCVVFSVLLLSSYVSADVCLMFLFL